MDSTQTKDDWVMHIADEKIREYVIMFRECFEHTE